MTIDAQIPVRTKEEIAAMFRQLRELKLACGKNKHIRVPTLIDAVLTEGINTKPRIIGALRQLDYAGDHVAVVLAEGVKAKRWQLSEAGEYCPASERSDASSTP